MRRGTLQYCVLSLLAEDERYGFDLVRELAEVDGMVTSEGTIYPLLADSAGTAWSSRVGRSRRQDLRVATTALPTPGVPRLKDSSASGRASGTQSITS